MSRKNSQGLLPRGFIFKISISCEPLDVKAHADHFIFILDAVYIEGMAEPKGGRAETGKPGRNAKSEECTDPARPGLTPPPFSCKVPCTLNWELKFCNAEQRCPVLPD
jgi:hypothetical protein